MFNSHFEDLLDCSTASPFSALKVSPLLGIQQFENAKQQRKMPGSDIVSSQSYFGSTCEERGIPQRLQGMASAVRSVQW